VAEGKMYLSPQITDVVVSGMINVQSLADTAARAKLGDRERQVLQLLAEGKSSKEIGSRLHISTATVETHRRNVMRKLDLHNVAELTKYAIREGLTNVEK